MRRGYTLIEIIITVAITGILSVGMFKAFEAITLRSEKAKILATLSIDSQSALDQISTLLYNRAPMSVKGCTDNIAPCLALDVATNATILQWYGTASESYTAGDYSGFVDMNRSIALKPILYTPETNLTKVVQTEQDKWGATFTVSDMALIFSGSFDEGNQNEYNITNIGLNNINISSTPPSTIYEKYSLVDSAYAVTRKADITALGCTNVLATIDDNALLLFYDYRPWKGQNFCTHGKVSILDTNVTGFAAHVLNGTIRLGIDTNRTAGKTTSTVSLSKQKVVF